MKNFKNKILFFAALALLANVAFAITGSEAAAGIITGVASVATAYLSIPSGVFQSYVGNVSQADAANGSVLVTNNERDRSIFVHNSNDVRFKGKKMTPSYLRLEAEITPSNNIIEFKTYSGDSASVYATERRLDRNDAFICSDLGIFLLKQDEAARKTNGELKTYPSQQVFTAAQAADLMAIYNGFFKATIDQDVRIVGLDMLRFLQVPETQQSAPANYDQRAFDTGFIPQTPQIVIDGSGTNELVVQYPTYPSWAGHSATAGVKHKLVLYMRGLLVTGGSMKQ